MPPFHRSSPLARRTAKARRPGGSAAPRRAIALTLAAALLAAAPGLLPVAQRSLHAQAINHPALQTPRVTERDYTGAVVGGSGTAMLFQWREGVSPRSHLGLDVGVLDPDGDGDATLFVGGNLGWQLARSQSDQPLDVLFTAGAGLALADGNTLFRLPVGVAIGHRFPLDAGMAVTPFVHPRLSFDSCSGCGRRDEGRRRGRSDLSVNFDIGGDFEFNEKLSLRAALLFSGADQFGSDDAFAIGLVWRPVGLRR